MPMPSIFRNTWVRTVVIPCALYFCTTWYYGWQYLYLLLLKEGTFSWKCEECNEDYPGWNPETETCLTVKGDVPYMCTSQENAVQSLYTIMTSAEFCGGILAGVLFDLVGYRVSLLIGYILHLIGITAVCQSTRHVPLYYVGALCSGLAVNINAYPGYFIRLFFPKKGGAVLMLNFAAQTATSSLMYFIFLGAEAGMMPFRSAQLVYSVVGIPLVLMYFMCLPKDRAECNKELADGGYEVEAQSEKTSFRHTLLGFTYWDTAAFAFCWYLPMIMATNIWNTCLAVLGGSDVSETVGAIQAWQFIFSLMMGLIQLGADKHVFIKWFPYGFLMIGLFIGLLSLVVGNDNSSWVIGASCVLLVSCSFIYASKYVYAVWVMDDAIFGSWCGLIATVTGVIQLSNVLWRSLAKDNLKVLVAVYAVIEFIVSIIGCVLFYRVESGKIWFLKYIVTDMPPEKMGILPPNHRVAKRHEKRLKESKETMEAGPLRDSTSYEDDAEMEMTTSAEDSIDKISRQESNHAFTA